MKKIFTLAVLAVAAAFGANAQESYAPEKGDFSVEVQVAPFSNSFKTFQIDGLQGRYFFSDKNAIRFGLGFGVNSNKSNESNDDDKLWTKSTNSNFSINLGFENHFFNYKRIDLYAGAGLGFNMNKINQTRSLGDDKKTSTSNVENSYNEFAVKAFTGIDFYVYKGLYVGAEIGIKIGAKHFPGSVVKGGINDSGNWSNSYEVSKGTSSSSFVLGTYAEPSVRLGWKF